MVKLVSLVGHRHRVDDLTIGWRAGLHVDHGERVGFRKVRTKQQGVGEALWRSFHCKLRRCVKGGIWPHGHRTASLFAWTCTNMAQRRARILAPSARLKHRRPDSGVITIHHQYGSVKRTMDARSAATNERKFFCVGRKPEDRL